MLVDALLEADKALLFSKSIYDADKFVKLDDTLVKTIANYGALGFRPAPSPPPPPPPPPSFFPTLWPGPALPLDPLPKHVLLTGASKLWLAHTYALLTRQHSRFHEVNERPSPEAI